MIILFLLKKIIFLLLLIVWFSMTARVVLNFFPVDEESPFVRLSYLLSEPLVIPVRTLINLFVDVETMQVDISYFVVYGALAIILRLMASA